MKRLAYIHCSIHYHGKDYLIVPAHVLIEMLSDYGWCFVNEGCVHYMASKELKEMIWKKNQWSYEDLETVVMQDQERKNIIGIQMKWKDTPFGGKLFFYPEPKKMNFYTMSFEIDYPRVFLLESD